MGLPRGAMGLRFVIVVLPDHTHLLFLNFSIKKVCFILLEISGIYLN